MAKRKQKLADSSETGRSELNIIHNGHKGILIETVGPFLHKLNGFTRCFDEPCHTLWPGQKTSVMHSKLYKKAGS